MLDEKDCYAHPHPANKGQRVAIFVGLLLVLAGVAWALVPYKADGRSCSLGAVEAVRDRLDTIRKPNYLYNPKKPGSREFPLRYVASPCAEEGRRRTITGGIVAAVGIIGGLAGVLISRRSQDGCGSLKLRLHRARALSAAKRLVRAAQQRVPASRHSRERPLRRLTRLELWPVEGAAGWHARLVTPTPHVWGTPSLT